MGISEFNPLEVKLFSGGSEDGPVRIVNAPFGILGGFSKWISEPVKPNGNQDINNEM